MPGELVFCNVLFLDEELDAVHKAAEGAGLETSEFIRRSAMWFARLEEGPGAIIVEVRRHYDLAGFPVPASPLDARLAKSITGLDEVDAAVDGDE